MLNLHNLQANHKATSSSKRRGRGNASGAGNYSGRGSKGQRARSGGKSGLASRSIKSYLLRIPKSRGFRSLQNKMEVVNLHDLQQNFSNGATVKPRNLLLAGLIKNLNNKIKVLSQGELSKKLIIQADAFSKEAKDKIVKAGGQAIVISRLSNSKKKKEDKPVVEKQEDIK